MAGRHPAVVLFLAAIITFCDSLYQCHDFSYLLTYLLAVVRRRHTLYNTVLSRGAAMSQKSGCPWLSVPSYPALLSSLFRLSLPSLRYSSFYPPSLSLGPTP